MAFSLDSLAAVLLVAISVWSWRAARGLRASIRVQLRFAAVLVSAEAASLLIPEPGLALNVALIAECAAAAALALGYCFPRGVLPWVSGLALTLSLAAGLAASLAARSFLAVGSVAAAATCILAASFWRLDEQAGAFIAGLAAAIALFIGALDLMGGGAAQAMLLFASALGLIARASQKPVADADAGVELAIGRKRA